MKATICKAGKSAKSESGQTYTIKRVAIKKDTPERTIVYEMHEAFTKAVCAPNTVHRGELLAGDNILIH